MSVQPTQEHCRRAGGRPAPVECRPSQPLGSSLPEHSVRFLDQTGAPSPSWLPPSVVHRLAHMVLLGCHVQSCVCLLPGRGCPCLWATATFLLGPPAAGWARRSGHRVLLPTALRQLPRSCLLTRFLPRAKRLCAVREGQWGAKALCIAQEAAALAGTARPASAPPRGHCRRPSQRHHRGFWTWMPEGPGRCPRVAQTLSRGLQGNHGSWPLGPLGGLSLRDAGSRRMPSGHHTGRLLFI